MKYTVRDKTIFLSILLFIACVFSACNKPAQPSRADTSQCEASDIPKLHFPSSCEKVSKLHSLPQVDENLQVVLWNEQEQGHKNTVKKLKKTLLQILCSDLYSTNDDAHLGGAMEKTLVHFENGIQGIFKYDPIARGNLEVSAYIVDQLYELNIVPMTIYRNINNCPGSLQVFINNALESKLGLQLMLTAPLSFEARNSLLQSEKKFYTIAILDYLLANTDRHGGNSLILPHLSRAVAIDHSWAFTLHATIHDEGYYYLEDPSHIARYLQHEPQQLTEKIRSVAFLSYVQKKLRPYLSTSQIEEFSERIKQLRNSPEFPPAAHPSFEGL